MKPLTRYGRKIPIPSMLQVRREIAVFSAAEEKRERAAADAAAVAAAGETAVARDAAHGTASA